MKNTTLEIRGETYILAHDCKGQRTHIFDIKSQTFVPNPKNSISPSLLDAVMTLESHKDFIATLVGTSSFLTVAGISKAAANRKGNWVALVLGLVSGYSAGYWLTAKSELQCDSLQIQNALDDKESWKGYHRDFLTILLFELGVRDPKWYPTTPVGDQVTLGGAEQSRRLRSKDGHNDDDTQQYYRDPINICETDISRAIYLLAERLDQREDPKPKDFVLAARYKRVLAHVRAQPLYNTMNACIQGVFKTHTPFMLPGKDEMSPTHGCESLGIKPEFDYQMEESVTSDEMMHQVLDGKPKTYSFQRTAEFIGACNQLKRIVNDIR